MRSGVLTWVKRFAIVFLLLNITPNAFGQEVEIRYRHALTVGVAAIKVDSPGANKGLRAQDPIGTAK